ncbi:hypothetical protein ACLHDG_04590 [Sulfurovum sp. CS9]|uniref:hypothetical protein n=1 Tax=Sulfurovum sp. CS9 TaxID=3391146 RepID=UPI0039EB3CAD
MAIDFTMTEKGLFAETTTQPPDPGTVPGEISSYLEPVNLPKCDANNPEVQFIRNNADWQTINSSSKRIFCVSPGNYKSLGNIKLTANGTAEKRRYIILNNGNDTHPGKLNDSELANYKLKFKASYWTVDRCAIINDGGYVVTMETGASYNILNRMYTRDVGSSVSIRDNAHNNTIQNSRFEDQRDPGYDGSVCIQIQAWGTNYFQVHNTKVINNEFYNQNDGFQIVRGAVSNYRTAYQDGNAEGTIVDSNHFYKDVPYMENAIDIKCGSDNPNNPVIISNNYMWGYRQHPDYVPGSYGPGVSAIQGHYSPKNIHIINNVFFDCETAINIGSNGPSTGFDKGFIGSVIKNNLIYDCGGGTRTRYPLKFSSMRDTDMSHNSFVNNHYKYYAFLAFNGASMQETYFRNNDICGESSEWSEEKYINSNHSAFINSLSSNTNCAKIYNKDLVFTADKFTNNPRVITLENAIEDN